MQGDPARGVGRAYGLQRGVRWGGHKEVCPHADWLHEPSACGSDMKQIVTFC